MTEVTTGTLPCGPLREGYRIIKPIDYEIYPPDEDGWIYVATPAPSCWFAHGTSVGVALTSFIDTLIRMYELERAERWDEIPECYLTPPVKEYIKAAA